MNEQELLELIYSAIDNDKMAFNYSYENKRSILIFGNGSLEISLRVPEDHIINPVTYKRCVITKVYLKNISNGNKGMMKIDYKNYNKILAYIENKFDKSIKNITFGQMDFYILIEGYEYYPQDY